MFSKKKVSLSDKVAGIMTELNAEVTAAQQESDEALDMFRSTVVKLDNANKRIDDSVLIAKAQISDLENVVYKLNQNKVSNDKVKTKIQEFLGN